MILVQSVVLFYQKRFHKFEVGFLPERGEKLKDGGREMHQSLVCVLFSPLFNA